MTKENLRSEELYCDLCVIGGGLSGSFAALSAARHGAKVVLMQDRPMLGGNASSEIRMWVRGAKGPFDRESGLINELEERNIHGNPTLVHSLFDATLFGMLRENENITLLLNTSCLDAKAEDGVIRQVTGWQLTTYTYFTVRAKLFMDCSGDSILAPLVGAAYRHGRESGQEYGETLAPAEADTHTMGMSIILAARETDHPVKYTPPAFAHHYPDDSCFDGDPKENIHALARDHKIGTSGANLWWVELGGQGNSIYDAEQVRNELLASIYGVWDHLKNQGDHGMENWDLDWVGFLPGKRESRRYVGLYTMTEQDVVSGGHFHDEIAYGGWPLDDHNPYGMLRNEGSNVASISIPVKEAYGIPLRCLCARDVKNLMFAGRNISVTHTALSSTRVMGTCAVIGQAAGTAAAVALRHSISPKEAALEHYQEVQKILLDDGAFLPHIRREASEMTKSAALNLSKEDRLRLLNGWERPRNAEEENGIWQSVGDSLTFTLEKPQQIGALRLQFDPDFGRMSISDNRKMRVFAMKLHTGLDFKPVRVANTIVKDFVVYADGVEVARMENNYRSLVTVPLNIKVRKIRVQWLATNGAEKVHLFSADLLEK